MLRPVFACPYGQRPAFAPRISTNACVVFGLPPHQLWWVPLPTFSTALVIGTLFACHPAISGHAGSSGGGQHRHGSRNRTGRRPSGVQLGMPLRPPTANEMLKSRPSRINPEKMGKLEAAGLPDSTVLPLLRRTASRLPAFPYFITSGLPSYTIGSISGAPHADTRGCLETVVRIHGFGEPAQTHARCRSMCSRLCAQNGRR